MNDSAAESYGWTISKEADVVTYRRGPETITVVRRSGTIAGLTYFDGNRQTRRNQGDLNTLLDGLIGL